MKRITSLLLLLGATLSSYAQQVLTLDSCRALALANNKELRISQEKSMPPTMRRRLHSLIICLKLILQGIYAYAERNIPAQ